MPAAELPSRYRPLFRKNQSEHKRASSSRLPNSAHPPGPTRPRLRFERCSQEARGGERGGRWPRSTGSGTRSGLALGCGVEPHRAAPPACGPGCGRSRCSPLRAIFQVALGPALSFGSGNGFLTNKMSCGECGRATEAPARLPPARPSPRPCPPPALDRAPRAVERVLVSLASRRRPGTCLARARALRLTAPSQASPFGSPRFLCPCCRDLRSGRGCWLNRQCPAPGEESKGQAEPPCAARAARPCSADPGRPCPSLPACPVALFLLFLSASLQCGTRGSSPGRLAAACLFLWKILFFVTYAPVVLDHTAANSPSRSRSGGLFLECL